MECTLCLDTFRNNKHKALLPCLHLICSQCLDDLKHFNTQELKCKVCFEYFALASVGVVSESSCTSATIPGPRCLQHPDQEISAFCETCQVLVCVCCISDIHFDIEPGSRNKKPVVRRGHIISSLQLYQQKQVNMLLQRLPELTEAIKNLNHAKIQREDRLIELKAEIKETFLPIIKANPGFADALDSRCKCLQLEASKLLKSDIKTIDSYLTLVQTNKEQIEQVRDHPAFAFLAGKMPLQYKQQINLPDLNQLLFVFLDTFDPENSIIEEMGTIVRCNLNGNWRNISQPTQVFGAQDHLYGPSDIDQIDNGYILVAYHKSKCLQVLHPQGKPIRSAQLPYNVNHVAFAQDGKAWVTCCESNLLVYVTLQHGNIFRQVQVERPFGVAILPNRLIAVSCLDGKVRAFSSSGVLQWTSSGDGLNCPRGIVVRNDNELVVCDYGNHRLQRLSTIDGHFIQSVGNAKQLKFPHDLSFISGTDVVVVAQRSKMSIITMDGFVIHQWRNKSYQRQQFDLFDLSAVTVLRDGRIAATDYPNNSVQIFSANTE